MTRATHHLLHGDVIGALHFNLLLPLALAMIVLGWVSWVTSAAGHEVATLRGAAMGLRRHDRRCGQPQSS
jgi:hypothetical protein